MMLSGRYEISLVLISILVAIFASYTALRLAGRVTRSQGMAVYLWTGGGALAMGIGIWSMHFIGMLAFRLPIPIGYDFSITLLSLLLPIVVSGVALWQVSRPNLRMKRLATSALLMGMGINAMHYTGMAAMRMDPGIVYDPLLFSASVVIAIMASAGALWIAFKLRQDIPHAGLAQLGAAVVMGIAIAGMHYTGMAAASFPLGSICRAASDGISQDGLAMMITIGTVGVLAITLLASFYDARLESHVRNLSVSQAVAEERQALLLREREARTQAERMSELKDEFLATLSHELRTPLNAVLGWAELLRRGVKDETTLQKGLETIERNALAQARLIDDLLDMSSILSGKVRLNVEVVNPAIFIEAAMDAVRPAAIAKNIRLEKRVDAAASQVLGDPNRLQQVMWNLLSNAVKFTPGGGTVQVLLEKSVDGIQIHIVDSGIGIKPEFLPYVFDRFRQEDASTTRRYGGLGLGLAIVKQLVELQEGTIHVNSRGEGRGTAFTVCFPFYKAQPAASDHRPGRNASPELQPLPDFRPVDLSGATVLVVDDEIDAIVLIEQILGDAGARILTATNAADALSLCQDERPDVIVSDIGMPEVDGYEFIRRVRMLEETACSNVPAIALTAFTHHDDKRKALLAGFTSFMIKPVEASLLLSTIASLVSEQG